MKKLESTRLNAQQFGEMSNAYFANIVKPLQCICIDIECLQDFRMGALLQLINTQEEYERVLAGFDEYANVTNNKIMSVYPNLPITEHEVEAYMYDPENAHKLAAGSPYTSVMAEFMDFMTAVLHHNSPVDNGQCHINFNCGLWEYPRQHWLEKQVTDLFPTVTVSFSSGPLNSKDINFYSQYDYYIIRDIQAFLLTESNSAKAMMTHGVFLDKLLTAQAYTNDEVVTDPKLIPQALHDTEIALDLCTTFQFFYRKLIRM